MRALRLLDDGELRLRLPLLQKNGQNWQSNFIAENNLTTFSQHVCKCVFSRTQEIAMKWLMILNLAERIVAGNDSMGLVLIRTRTVEFCTIF